MEEEITTPQEPVAAENPQPIPPVQAPTTPRPSVDVGNGVASPLPDKHRADRPSHPN